MQLDSAVLFWSIFYFYLNMNEETVSYLASVEATSPSPPFVTTSHSRKDNKAYMGHKTQQIWNVNNNICFSTQFQYKGIVWTENYV